MASAVQVPPPECRLAIQDYRHRDIPAVHKSEPDIRMTMPRTPAHDFRRIRPYFLKNSHDFPQTRAIFRKNSHDFRQTSHVF
jgi:hypothetical protein